MHKTHRCKGRSFFVHARWLSSLLAWLVASHAGAQACHAPSLRPVQADDLFRAEARAIAAKYAAGHYEGGGLLVSFLHEHVALDLGFSYYGIERAGERARGLGDVLAAAHVPVYRKRSDAAERFAFGPELVATLPTGDSAKGLGMGHVMLMPGMWARFRHERFSFAVQLAYGVALTDGHDHGASDDGMAHHHAGHHMHEVAEDHAGGPAPIVNPMNRSEFEHAVAAAFQWTNLFALSLRVYGAVPLSDERGEAREVVAPGLLFTLGSFDLSVTGEVPVVGDPFTFRTVLGLAAQW